MSEFKRLTAREAAQIIARIKSPSIAMHTHPDADTVGSATALALVFRELGTDARLMCEDEIPERLKFLTEGIELTDKRDAKANVSIDVASPSQLGSLSSLAFNLMIDHHAKGTPFADYFIVHDASSAAEVLLEIIEELEQITEFTLTKDIAERLYAAMSSDTGGFIYSSAAPSTYRRAAALIECGIDHADINHRLFNSKSKKQIAAEGFISSSLRTAASGRIAYALLTRAEREKMGIESQFFDTAIDVVRALKGAEIALFIRETDDGKIRASLRSTGANVASVAEKFNGGGHIRAAGCTPEAESVEEAAKNIIEELEKII